jgi:hypothetical protein
MNCGAAFTFHITNVYHCACLIYICHRHVIRAVSYEQMIKAGTISGKTLTYETLWLNETKTRKEEVRPLRRRRRP